MKLWCTSFEGFRKLLNDNNWDDNNLPDNVAFISICDTEKINDQSNYTYETHLLSDNHDNVINLDFDDICGYSMIDIFPDDEMVIGNTTKGLTDKQAEQLYNFIETNIDKDIYVHCAAGISRSQGIVRFILDCYPDRENEMNPDNPCKYPNIHVVSLLKRQYRKNIYKDE